MIAFQKRHVVANCTSFLKSDCVFFFTPIDLSYSVYKSITI